MTEQYEIDAQAKKARKALFDQWFEEMCPKRGDLDFYVATVAWAERCVSEFPRYEGETTYQISESWEKARSLVEGCKLTLAEYVLSNRLYLVYSEPYHKQFEEGTGYSDRFESDAQAAQAADRQRREKNHELLLKGE